MVRELFKREIIMWNIFFLFMLLMALGCGKESSSIKQNESPKSENVSLGSIVDSDGDGIADSLDDLPFVADVPTLGRFYYNGYNITLTGKGLKDKVITLKTKLSADKMEPELLKSFGEEFPKNFDLWDYGSNLYITSRPENESIHEALRITHDLSGSKVDGLDFFLSSLIEFEFDHIKSIKNIQFKVLMIDMVNGEITELDDIFVNEEFEPFKQRWINLSFRIKGLDLSRILDKVIKGDIRFAFGMEDCSIDNDRGAFSRLLSRVKSKSVEVSGQFSPDLERSFVSSDKIRTIEDALGFILQSGFSIESTLTWSNGGEVTVNTFDGEITYYYIFNGVVSNGMRSKVLPGDRVIFLKKPITKNLEAINSQGSFDGSSKEVFTNINMKESGLAEIFISNLSFRAYRLKWKEVVKNANICKSNGNLQAGMVSFNSLNYTEMSLNWDDKDSIDLFLEKIILSYNDSERTFKHPGFPHTQGSYRMIEDGLVISIPVKNETSILKRVTIRGEDKNLDTSDTNLKCLCPGIGLVQCPTDIVNGSKKPIQRFTDSYKFDYTSFL